MVITLGFIAQHWLQNDTGLSSFKSSSTRHVGRLWQFRGLGMNQMVEVSCYCVSENGVENQKYISPFAHNLPSQNSAA
jgi:hypothetical protein